MAETDNIGSSKSSGSNAANLPPRRVRPGILAGLLLTAGILLLVGLTVFNQLDPGLLLICLFPAAMLALYFGRYLFLPVILLVSGTYGAKSLLYGNTILSIVTALVGFGLALVLAEILHQLGQTKRRVQDQNDIEQVRLERLLSLSRDGLALVDSKGRIQSWNPAMTEITGMEPGMVRGRMYWDVAYRLLPDDQRTHAFYEEMKEAFRQFSERGEVATGQLVKEREIIRPQGVRLTVQEIIFPITTSNGGAFGMIFHDFSERKKQEHNLQDANEMLLRSVYELQERNLTSSQINEMGDQLNLCTEMEMAYEVVSRHAEHIFAGLSGSLFVFNENVNLFERKGVWGQPAGELDSFGMEGCWAIKNGRVHAVSDTKVEPLCHHLDFPGEGYENLPYLCIPMVTHGETIGILHIQGREEMSLELLEQKGVAVTGRIAMVLTNLRLKEQLRVQAIRDPLTGLFNRRYMEVTFDRELRRAIRDQSSLGVVRMEIDHTEAKIHSKQTLMLCYKIADFLRLTEDSVV